MRFLKEQDKSTTVKEIEIDKSVRSSWRSEQLEIEDNSECSHISFQFFIFTGVLQCMDSNKVEFW